MNQVLGGYTFPYDPAMGDWSGVNQNKSRADLDAITRTISFNWGFVDYKPVILKWSSIPKTMYDQLVSLWIANNGGNTYTYNPRTGTSYTVEIVDLVGTPFGPTGSYDWLIDVQMTLKVLL
jgi:hypothetical protein